jgi:hypothetical protein
VIFTEEKEEEKEKEENIEKTQSAVFTTIRSNV